MISGDRGPIPTTASKLYDVEKSKLVKVKDDEKNLEDCCLVTDGLLHRELVCLDRMKDEVARSK